MWLVLRSSKKDTNGYKLSQGDIIRFGKIRYLVSRLVLDRDTSSNVVPICSPKGRVK
jgi:hypothetical protein